jgi:hypothetical protein
MDRRRLAWRGRSRRGGRGGFWPVAAGFGMAWRSWFALAWRGEARRSLSWRSRQCMAGPGACWQGGHGSSRHVQARPDRVGRGRAVMARQRCAGQVLAHRGGPGRAGCGMAGCGMARCGRVRRGRVGQCSAGQGGRGEACFGASRRGEVGPGRTSQRLAVAAVMAWRDRLWRGGSWRSWRCLVRRLPARLGTARPGGRGDARRGGARLGPVWRGGLGVARRGLSRQHPAVKARPVQSWQGPAFTAGLDAARSGPAGQSRRSGLDAARHGRPRHGAARRVEAVVARMGMARKDRAGLGGLGGARQCVSSYGRPRKGHSVNGGQSPVMLLYPVWRSGDFVT